MGIRAPLFGPRGEYDASDFRGLVADLRGQSAGVIRGTNPDALRVTAVSGSSARVAVAGGRAWVPLTRAGVRERAAYLVELPSPGVQFNVAPSSATTDRVDLVVIRAAEDTDTTPYAELPLANYVPGSMAPGWCVDVVKGVDGGPSPSVPWESYLILARVRVRRGATTVTAADIEDLRWSTPGQSDPTVLAPVRTAPGQTVGAAATGVAPGALVYSTDEDRMYVRGQSDARPLTYRPTVITYPTSKGATGWWSSGNPTGWDGRVMAWEGPAAPYDRLGMLTFQMRWQAPGGGREGWTSAWIFSAGSLQWETMRVYSNVGGVHTGTVMCTVPKDKPLSVVAHLYGQNGWCQFDEWQSAGQLLLVPAE
ncbi:hypothetical protein [Kitasatospora sp. NPDC094011]|uniref:hypothetical protein n=1 Tax=Kitasatospora sp. NPDC094011 TaxID=3364090 RepID=UPI00380D42DE